MTCESCGGDRAAGAPDRCGNSADHAGGTPVHVPPPGRLLLGQDPVEPTTCYRAGMHHCTVTGGWQNHDLRGATL